MNVESLTKTINQQVILKDVSFQLHLGEIIGLIGRNGAGKTTLFKSLSGQYDIDSGDYLVGGVSFKDDVKVRREIFYVDEKRNILKHLTPLQIAQYYAAAYPSFNSEKYGELLERYGIKKDARYRTWSKGMQAVFLLILALSSGAKYLLLDEPFDGLDMLAKRRAMRLLLEESSSGEQCALIASHNLKELESIADRALILKDHQITENIVITENTSMKKVQLVYPSKEVPAVVQEKGIVLSVQGRVVIVLFKSYTPEVKNALQASNPVLFEELPVTLEDIFASELTQEEDYQLFE